MQTYTRIILMLLLAATSSAMPQRNHRQRSLRLVDLPSTPYPAAGFRPRIPFDLPNERQPRLEDPLVTTTEITLKTSIEDFGSTDEQATTTELVIEDIQKNPRKPAINYGAPEQPIRNPEDAVKVKAQAPTEDFQPPVHEAVEDFSAVAIDSVHFEQQPVADLPAVHQFKTTDLNIEEEISPTEIPVKEVPESTYGAPQSPASSYGTPEIDEPDNELETEETQSELVEEPEHEPNAATLGLSSGRLVLLPFNAPATQFGRFILALEQPKQQHPLGRNYLRSERLRRN